MTAIWPAGPPKGCSEIRNQTRTAVRKGTGGSAGGCSRRRAASPVTASGSGTRRCNHGAGPDARSAFAARQRRRCVMICADASTTKGASMDAVRFGLVGYGFGGRWFHAPLLAAAPECDFLGVVTSSPDRRALVAQDHPGLATFSALEDLRNAGSEAVAISTP